ncbi:hypothetical protein RI367_002365 [Sorochytrium milnesiophthora]
MQPRTIKLVAGGTVLYATTVYLSYRHFATPKATPPPEPLPPSAATDGQPSSWREQTDRSRVYDDIARTYDNEIGWDEWVMGLLLLRRLPDERARASKKGDTLEIAAGTGRNLPYVKLCASEQDKAGGVTSLTLLDASPGMLSMLGDKLRRKFSGARERIRTQQGDVLHMPFPARSFDTVLSTFSLCSLADPVAGLAEVQRVCKDDGTVLLLEHGRSHYDWLNNVLDRGAPRHSQQWGCWYNRDIGKIVQESGLVVRRVSRWHFGTTWMIEAAPAARLTTTE